MNHPRSARRFGSATTPRRNLPVAVRLVFCAALATGSAWAAEPLNVKPGLWEITSDTEMSGVPPLPREILERMDPEQRATLEAALKAQADRGPLHDVTRECVTPKDLEQPFAAEDLEENCSQTVITRTSTTQEIRLSCTGERKGTGLLRVTATTPETMTGTFELEVSDANAAMTLKSRISGRWLEANCGDAADTE